MNKIIIRITAATIIMLTALGTAQAQSYKTILPVVRDIPTAVETNSNATEAAVGNLVVSSSQGKLLVHFTKNPAEKVDITLYDLTGREILRDVAESGSDAFYKTYDPGIAQAIILVELRYKSIKIVKKAMI